MRTEEDKLRFEDYKASLLRYGFSDQEATKQAAIRLQKDQRDAQKRELAAKFFAKQGHKGKKGLQDKVYDQVRAEFLRKHKGADVMDKILSQEGAEHDIYLK